MTGFDPKFADLPKDLPVFPLKNVLLLPKGRVTLKIVEPCDIALIDEVMRSHHRMVVVAQPCSRRSDFGNDGGGGLETLCADNFYPVGCAGRIVKFTEMLDCRYHIELRGMYRCRLAQEIHHARAYRKFHLDFMPYHHDNDVMQIDINIRNQLMILIKHYFRTRKIDFNTEIFTKLHDEVLVTSLAMVCPFSAAEKQALLEAPDLWQRADRLMSALMMDIGASESMALQ